MNTELSIEETNKLRAQLGLKPLPVSKFQSSQLSSSSAAAPASSVPSSNLSKARARNATLNKDLGGAVLAEGEIMTLKDADILDDELDQNELVTETEYLNSQLNNKRAPSGTSRKLHTFGEEDEGEARNVDDNGEGEFFKVGNAKVKLRLSEQSRAQNSTKRMEEYAAKNNRRLMTFDEEESREESSNEADGDDWGLSISAADYSSKKSSHDAGFKKHKKRKLKSKKKGALQEEEEDDEKEPREIELTQHVDLSKDRADDHIFDAEDELQATLSAQRAAAIKRRRALRNRLKRERGEPSDGLHDQNERKVAEAEAEAEAELKNVAADEEKGSDEELVFGNKGDTGLVIDANSEFLSALKQNILNTKNDSTGQKVEAQASNAQTEETQKEKAQQQSTQTAPAAAEPEEDIFDEPDFSGGLSATLSFLKKNAVLKVDEKAEHKSKQRLEQTRLKSRLGAEPSGDAFREYNPEVKITYTDDSNNVLTPKEAYKYLSHKFHGKGPSKKKQAKLLQRKQEGQ